MASANKQTKCNRHVQVNSKHVGLDCSAKTQSSFKVSQAFKQCATLAGRRGSKLKVNQSKKVDANSKFQSVLGAFCHGNRRRSDRLGAGDIACTAGTRDCEVEKERDD